MYLFVPPVVLASTTNSKWIIFTQNLSPVHCLFSLAVNQEHQGHFEDGLALVLKSSRRHGSGFTTEKRQYDLGGFDAMWNVIWWLINLSDKNVFPPIEAGGVYRIKSANEACEVENSQLKTGPKIEACPTELVAAFECLYHTAEYIFHVQPNVQDVREPLLDSLITVMINIISILPLFSLSFEEKICFFACMEHSIKKGTV